MKAPLGACSQYQVQRLRQLTFGNDALIPKAKRKSHGLITQLGECVPCKDEAEGSSPSRSTLTFRIRYCYNNKKENF